MLLLIQSNCDGFWSWPWGWPILLAFILGAILGWLLKSILGGNSNNNENEYRQKYLDTKAELDLCRRDNDKSKLVGAGALGAASLTSNNAINNDDNDNYKQKYLTLKGDLDTCNADLDACRKDKGSNSNIKASSFVNPAVVDDSVKDDLTKIEGIGPKIKGLLNDDGIWSWKQLSEVAVERIQKVLDNAGPRYKVHNPASWPMQADMCHKGEWKKLDKWQDDHKGGRL